MASLNKFLVLLLVQFYQIYAQCRGDEVQHGINCYHFSSLYYTFADAEKFCASRSEDLVSIHSQFDNQFISNEAAKQYGWSQFITTYFIGLTSQNSTDGKTFTWTDMSPYNFNAWAQVINKSVSSKSTKSLTIYQIKIRFYHFTFRHSIAFIMVYKAVFLIFLFLQIHQIHAACKADETESGGYCYYFDNKSKSFPSFSAAEIACSKRNMHLASIHSSFENNFVRSQANKEFGGSTDFYIGLTSEGSLDRMIFKWTDDSSVLYTAWGYNEPNPNYGCAKVHAASGDWQTHDCFTGLPFVCRGRNCYFFLKENYNFHEAEQFCNDHGGHLTSILNQFENNFVRAGANQYFGITEFDVCYIGLTSLNSTDGKTYSWLDGNALDFNHWQRGEPKDFVKNKCVVMRMYDGSWMTNDCVEKFPIVCKSPKK